MVKQFGLGLFFKTTSAILVYSFCCFFNWITHGYLLAKKILLLNLDINTVIYFILIIPIIRDDIILMSWLKNKVKGI